MVWFRLNYCLQFVQPGPELPTGSPQHGVSRAAGTFKTAKG